MPRGQDIRFRRGAAALWTSTNPVLNEGELGVDLDNDGLKVGDGVSTWTALPYVGSIVASGLILLTGSASNLIDFAAAGLSTPANGATPPVGQKLTLYKTRSSTDGDYAIGVASNEQWYSVGSSTSRAHRFYVANTQRLAITNGTVVVTGQLTVSAGSKLGTYRASAGSTTISATGDKYVEISAAGTATLPAASGSTGYDLYIINTHTAAITVSGASGAETIGNTASAAQTYSLAAGASLHVVSTGAKWRTI